MDGREMIHWIVLLQLSIVMVQAFNNRPVDHQRKILVRMVWPGGHVTHPPDEDTTPPAVVIPAATFSRQMVIRFPSSGSILPANRKPVSISSAGYDPFATEESADYSLDSYVSLSLSSGGSDAEGAHENLRGSNLRNDKSFDGSQLDLLQQLLRFSPSAVENENASGECNDPFHSWICKNNKDIVSSTTHPAAVTATEAPHPPEFFPVSSVEHVRILIPDLSPTVVPPLPAPPGLPIQGRASDMWAGMDPCNHPFHSWMCTKQRPKIIRPLPEFKQTGASTIDQNLLLPPVELLTTVKPSVTTPPLPDTTKRSGWDGADPCTHPFHSWLCDKRQPVAGTTSPRPHPPTTTIPQLFIPDASFFIPDFNPPAAPVTTTQSPPPPTTSLPVLIRTLVTKKGWDEADSCSHPFHSWLCEKPKIRTTTPQSTLPPPLVPTTTTTPDPVILPPPEEAVVFEPAPSMEEANHLVPDASPTHPPPTATTTASAKPTKSSGWDEADSCSHPFHSWLCVKAPLKTRTTTPPPFLPADIQFPEASNFETLDALPLLPPQILTTQTPAVRAAATEPSGWDAEGADPCTHAFHSWLCNRSPSIRQNLQLRPISRTGRQSDRTVQSESEALDEENLESSRWNQFESLRLPPSSGLQRK